MLDPLKIISVGNKQTNNIFVVDKDLIDVETFIIKGLSRLFSNVLLNIKINIDNIYNTYRYLTRYFPYVPIYTNVDYIINI